MVERTGQKGEPKNGGACFTREEKLSRLGTQKSHHLETRVFREAKGDIEILHSLARGAFDEIVLSAQQQEATRASVVGPAQVDEVGAGDVLRVRTLVATEQSHEGASGVSGGVCGLHFLQSDSLPESGKDGGADA